MLLIQAAFTRLYRAVFSSRWWRKELQGALFQGALFQGAFQVSDPEQVKARCLVSVHQNKICCIFIDVSITFGSDLLTHVSR